MYIITGITATGKIHRDERDEYTSAMLLEKLLKDSGKFRKVTMHQERAVWATGKRHCNACIEVSIYEHSIVAMAESDKLTPAMMHKALRREFPNHTFYTNNRSSANSQGYLRADADRWVNDGL